MEKAKKSKPLIQRQKEQFIYEQNKKKESLLQAKKNEIKEQVLSTPSATSALTRR